MSLLTDQEKQDIAEAVVHMSFDINYAESIAHVCELAEAAVIARLATVSVEPAQFEEWNAKQHGDPEEIGFLQALRIAYCCGQDSINPALAAARVQALEDAAKICECQWSTLEERDAGIEFAEAIRALIGGLNV